MNHARRTGMIAALSTYLIWGVLPLYWNLLARAEANEILAHRIIWSFFFMVVVLMVTKRWQSFKEDCRALWQNKKRGAVLLLAAFTISLNWLTYIWAVNHGHVIDTSIGYYINPLVSIVLGLVVFRERLTPLQIAATVLSAAGVIYFTVNYGSFPWIALVLAFTFGIYGAVKKRGGYPAVPTIAVEGIVALPFAIVALVAVFIAGQSVFFSPDMSLEAWQTRVLLVLTGPITAVPLILFATAANKTPLSLIGFIQYISPTISLLSGVLVLGEPFTSAHAVCFACIWAGAVLVIVDAIRKQARQ